MQFSTFLNFVQANWFILRQTFMFDQSYGNIQIFNLFCYKFT